ncbi:energy-coupling factor ABC transporter ATP-binding protein [Collinsella sp. AGMB00827]|uniref:Energy-coupling factor ABC transporter ATP-binding protein n=1 Tax=Collinsella ureilytica TaxID=2869515 RepID=A0ABS7MI73_9ACTN|nr:ABC transporter ATP-binding protein [Collinsella urealyticum]MBY4797055.1 energy-coupling factor ABC transporter ATP-binding protein [Collinsella urealyticum]
MTESVISIHDFSFRYPGESRYALQHISCQVERGEFFGIAGANGSGRSTLCSALVGLIPHYFRGKYRGSIHVLGLDTRSVPVSDLSSKIGFVFQNPYNQLSWTAETVGGELAFGLSNFGFSRKEMISRIEKVAALVGIQELLDRSPFELSGGQVQRVALGSVLVLEPEILLLDEAATQLDPLGAESIFEIVKELNQGGTTVISVDQDIERLASLSDRMMILNDGMLAALGTPCDVFTSHDVGQFGVRSSDYFEISKALRDARMTAHELTFSQSEAISVVKQVIEG